MKLNPKYNRRYVEGAGGARLFVEESGDPTKPTILWIHGYCQCRLSWDNQIENEELTSKFRMVRLDLSGHGLSDKLADPAAFQDGKIWAEDIRAVISALRLNKPVLAGSVGSIVSFRFHPAARPSSRTPDRAAGSVHLRSPPVHCLDRVRRVVYFCEE